MIISIHLLYIIFYINNIFYYTFNIILSLFFFFLIPPLLSSFFFSFIFSFFFFLFLFLFSLTVVSTLHRKHHNYQSPQTPSISTDHKHLFTLPAPIHMQLWRWWNRLSNPRSTDSQSLINDSQATIHNLSTIPVDPQPQVHKNALSVSVGVFDFWLILCCDRVSLFNFWLILWCVQVVAVVIGGGG